MQDTQLNNGQFFICYVDLSMDFKPFYFQIIKIKIHCVPGSCLFANSFEFELLCLTSKKSITGDTEAYMNLDILVISFFVFLIIRVRSVIHQSVFHFLLSTWPISSKNPLFFQHSSAISRNLH